VTIFEFKQMIPQNDNIDKNRHQYLSYITHELMAIFQVSLDSVVMTVNLWKRWHIFQTLDVSPVM